MALRPATLHHPRRTYFSRASTGCWWTSFALVGATPCFLGDRPTCHPIRESSVTIVWLRGRHTSTTLVRATLTMDAAAPFLFRHRPTGLPICEAICAIVGVRRGRRLRGLATNVVYPAAPTLLGSIPCEILPDGAIVRIDWPGWHHRAGHWRQPHRSRWRRWPRGWRRWRRCGWRGRWRCWEGSGRNRHWSLWKGCRRAAPANCHTAIVPLRLGPHPLHHACVPHAPFASHATIVWLRCCGPRQQPAEEWNQ